MCVCLIFLWISSGIHSYPMQMETNSFRITTKWTHSPIDIFIVRFVFPANWFKSPATACTFAEFYVIAWYLRLVFLLHTSYQLVPAHFMMPIQPNWFQKIDFAGVVWAATHKMASTKTGLTVDATLNIIGIKLRESTHTKWERFPFGSTMYATCKQYSPKQLRNICNARTRTHAK